MGENSPHELIGLLKLPSHQTNHITQKAIEYLEAQPDDQSFYLAYPSMPHEIEGRKK